MEIKSGEIDFYWFSGTGNTLLVANKMTEVFRSRGIEVNLFRIERSRPEHLDLGHTIGIAFPVACQSTFPLVWNFVFFP